MNDQFGFPRRSEVLASAGLAGATWKTFWVTPPTETPVITNLFAPYPFPGRYFTAPQQMGLPTVAGYNLHKGLFPLIRFTGTYIGGGTAQFAVALNSATVGTNIATWAGTTAVTASGYLYMTNPTSLVAPVSYVNNVSSVTATSITYGGQDLWFRAIVPLSGTLVCVVEYLDIPL